MEEFVRKDIEKTPNSFFYTPKRFISKAEAFSLKERDVYTFDQAESCGRLGRIVRSFGLNRAVVSGGCIYKMTMPEFTSHFFVYTY